MSRMMSWEYLKAEHFQDYPEKVELQALQANMDHQVIAERMEHSEERDRLVLLDNLDLLEYLVHLVRMVHQAEIR